MDRYLDRWDMRSRHEIVVNAPREETYRALRQLDMGRSVPVLALFTARAIPHLLTGKARLQRSLTLDDFMGLGFVILEEEPGRELLLGAVGRFWRPTSGVERIAAEEFPSFSRSGSAKAALGFTVEEVGPERSVLATETRVWCTDDRARRSFTRYWRAIGPFSGFIRHLMLREAKRSAETGV